MSDIMANIADRLRTLYATHPNCIEAADQIERYERALVEIEHHSTDKNAAATARAALAITAGERQT
jgi:hypothetical protein